MWMNEIYKLDKIRIDPADKNGIHLVQEGGERIYVTIDHIPQLIENLKEVYDEHISL